MKNQAFKTLASACGLILAGAAAAQEPLLMEGKSTLYQRVLTTPSCILYPSAEAAQGEKVPVFSRYYVYERAGGKILVGPDTSGKTAGYLTEDCTVPWKMQMALQFTPPGNRERALIFDNYDALYSIVSNDDPASVAQRVYESLGQTGKASHVVSQEPETYVDFSKNFYLLPILDSSYEEFADDWMPVRLLKIASVTDKEATAAAAAQQQGEEGATSGITAFKAAIVFVLDSSISMQPYIDKTKEIIREVYKSIEADGLGDSVQFGLVSFRSNLKATPALEYTSKIFVTPGEVSSGAEFEQKVGALKQATVSSVLFDEDAFAGVESALSSVDWTNYGGRYVVLITDAGAIEASNQYSSTKLDAKELRAEAEHYNTAIYAMHLLTAAGKKNHDKARAQYEELSFNQVLQKPLYYPIDAGSVDTFGQNIKSVASQITEQVKLASLGEEAAGSAAGMKTQLEEDTALLGYAMKLRFLGSYNNERAPDLIEGFMADRDLIKHNMPSAHPVVLLTKAQLSDLKDVASRILEQANVGTLNPSQMFSNLLSMAAAMNNDAASLTSAGSLQIAQMGLLGEYIEDLPYRSEIAALTEEDWAVMAPEEQDNLIRSLESKLEYYSRCNADEARWIDLTEGADKAEAVYPVSLEMLP